MTTRKNQPVAHNSLTIQNRLLALEEQKQALDREISLINSHRQQAIHSIVKDLMDIAVRRDSYGITQKEINNAMISIQSGVHESAKVLLGVPALDEVKKTKQQQESPSAYDMMGVAQPYEQHQHQQQVDTPAQQPVYQPEHPQEDFSQMGVAQPEYPQEDFSQMGVAQPEHPQEDFSQMGVAQPEYPQEDYSQMGAAQPEHLQEDYSQMGVAQPEPAQQPQNQRHQSAEVAENSNNPFRHSNRNNN